MKAVLHELIDALPEFLYHAVYNILHPLAKVTPPAETTTVTTTAADTTVG